MKKSWNNIFLLVLLSILSIVLGSDTAFSTGTIIGKVTDLNNNPVNNAHIYVSGPPNKSVYTAITGTYTISGLSEGIYTIYYQSDDNLEFINQQKNNITVPNGQTTTIDFLLVKGGIITGRVTDTNGNPVYKANISVSGPEYKHEYTYTAITGTYTIRGLNEGIYKISCSPPYESGLLPQYQTKTDIMITYGQTTSVDFSLVVGGIITGQVTDVWSTPISNARIYVSGPTNKSVYTTTTGTYTISGLSEGNYNIYCLPDSNSDFIHQNKNDILIMYNQTTTTNFSLNPGGIIDGQVTDSKGISVNNILVWASSDTTNKRVYTTATGTYSIRGLAEGVYELYYLPNEDSEFVLQRISNITVHVGHTTTTNCSLVTGGIIAGRVTDLDGNPVYNAHISVAGPTSKSYYTTITGTFTISGLNEGDYYKVHCNPPYLSELLSQEKSRINVNHGQTTAVNFSLAKQPILEGIITGKVTDSNDNPVNNAYIYVTGPTYKSVYTVSAGTYTISGLSEGNYKITCIPQSDSDFISQQKTNITMTYGQITTVNFSLAVGGTINGRVTDSNGNPIDNANVYVNGLTYKNTYTTTTGTYTIRGLNEGITTVFCQPSPDLELAVQQKTDVVITNGQITIVDFSLVKGGIITGRVIDSYGNPVYNATVYANGPTFKWINTTATGTFIICGLSEGHYSAYCYCYYLELNSQTVTDIQVILGKVTSLDFVLPPLAPAIHGTVYHSNGKTLFTGAKIKLYSAETKFVNNTIFNTIVSDKIIVENSANYKINHIYAGSYDIYAVSGTTIIASRYGVKTQSDQATYLDLVDESGTGSIKGQLGTYSVSSSSYNTGTAMVWVTYPGSERLAGYTYINNVVTDTFTITGLTSGEYNVYSYVSNVGLNKLSAVQVTNGAVTDVSFNYSVNNVSAGLSKLASGSNWQVEIPTGSFTDEIIFYVNPRASSPEINDANDIMPKSQLPEELASCVWEVHVTNVAGTSILPTKKVKLTFSYPDLSQASLTTTNISDQLAVYVLRSYPPPYPPERKGMKWVLLDGVPQIDSINRTVSTEVSSFSYFRLALKYAARQDLSVRVYPNPYRPATDSKLTFSGLTQDAEIKIYNLVGEEVKSIPKNDGTDKAFWVGDNDYKDKVASGIYFYRITNNKGQAAKGKIAVIR